MNWGFSIRKLHPKAGSQKQAMVRREKKNNPISFFLNHLMFQYSNPFHFGIYFPRCQLSQSTVKTKTHIIVQNVTKEEWKTEKKTNRGCSYSTHRKLKEMKAAWMLCTNSLFSPFFICFSISFYYISVHVSKSITYM